MSFFRAVCFFILNWTMLPSCPITFRLMCSGFSSLASPDITGVDTKLKIWRNTLLIIYTNAFLRDQMMSIKSLTYHNITTITYSIDKKKSKQKCTIEQFFFPRLKFPQLFYCSLPFSFSLAELSCACPA